MYRLNRLRRIRVCVPAKERPERKVLHNRELGQHFGVKHFDHALVDLAPAILDAGHIEEDGTVFPKGSLFHVVYEPHCREIHVRGAVLGHEVGLDDVGGLGGSRDGALEGRGLVGGDSTVVLGAAEDVGDEGVVVKAPDAVRAGGLESIGEDEAADNSEVSGVPRR